MSLEDAMTHENNEHLSQPIVNDGERDEDFERDLRDDNQQQGGEQGEQQQAGEQGGDERTVTLPPDTVVTEPETTPESERPE